MNPILEFPPTRTEVGNYFISNYPPFSCWNAEHIPALRQRLDSRPDDRPLGLYVHLPFCRQRCHYCYFRVYPRCAREDVDLYIDSVLKELSLYRNSRAFLDRPVTSVYFGGGSPSYLDTDQIERLLGGLQAERTWKSVQECTFECEPGTVSPKKLRTLKSLGVMRLSIGFQTLTDTVLRRSGRDVTARQALEAFALARDAGFTEINIDLLAGLPGETTDSWGRTIDRVADLLPDCVTIYQLELTHNSRLYASMQVGRHVDLPNWALKRQWAQHAFEALERAGYTIGSAYMAIRDPAHWRFVYTVEHFWHGADLLALGETAFGHVQGVHYQNTDTFERYTSMVARNELPLRRAYRLSPEEQMCRELVLHLKTGVVNAAYFRQKFNVELAKHFATQIEFLREHNLADVNQSGIQLTRAGLLQADWLLPHFYLPEHVGIRYT